MSSHEAFIGVNCDHLYANCPSLTQAKRWLIVRDEEGNSSAHKVAVKCLDQVDPEGSDICGLCRRRWETKQ